MRIGGLYSPSMFAAVRSENNSKIVFAETIVCPRSARFLRGWFFGRHRYVTSKSRVTRYLSCFSYRRRCSRRISHAHAKTITIIFHRAIIRPTRSCVIAFMQSPQCFFSSCSSREFCTSRSNAVPCACPIYGRSIRTCSGTFLR